MYICVCVCVYRNNTFLYLDIGLVLNAMSKGLHKSPKNEIICNK